MNTTLELFEIDCRVGQLFMIGMPGPELDDITEKLIRDYNIGGIILFSRNISDPLQLAGLLRKIKETARRYHRTNIFIAIDQEGGRVARLKTPFHLFPGNEAIGKNYNPLEKAQEFGEVTAREMKLVGLNMDMAPVVDVRGDYIDRHLEGRIFSDKPESVAELGSAVIESLQENGIMAVAKHFPGLGRALFDPHLEGITIDTKLRDLEKKDLSPFIAAIESNVSAIMTSHAVYPALDPEYPATLSRKILTDLLRNRLGFKGLIITDDLDMGAISGKTGVSKGALESFRAGADILLISRNQEEVMESLELVRKNILMDERLAERLNGSFERIMKAKSLYLKREKKVPYAEIRKYFRI